MERWLCAGWVWLYAVYTTIVLASGLGFLPLASAPFCAAVWCAAGIFAAFYGHLASFWRTNDPRPPAGFGAGTGLLVAGGLALSVCFGLALLLPVGAYDALGYRLPAVAQWLDAGRVSWVGGDDMLRNGYPLAQEVLAACAAAASFSLSAADAFGVVFVLLSGLTLQREARILGLSRDASGLSAGLSMLVPMQLLNAPSGYADAPFAATLVATLLLAARFARGETERGDRVLLGICAGLTIALKPPGIAFAGLPLLLALWLRGRSVGKGAALRELWPALVVLTPGLFFLLRNVLHTHNPLYPVEVRLFGRVLLPGESSLEGILTPDANVPPALRALPRLLRPPAVWLQLHGPAIAYDDRQAGLGYAFVFAALPAMIWVAWTRLWQRRDVRAVGFVLGVTWLLFALQPFSFWPRFTTWLWGAGALCIACALDAVRVARPKLAASLTVGLALWVAGEASYALGRIKHLDQYGRAIFDGDVADKLARVSGVRADFVREALLHRRAICRTGWTDGTDDANLDGVVAQLSPRPSMHVVFETEWPAVQKELRARGCDDLIAIGHSPLRAPLPPEVRGRTMQAFGFVDVLEVGRE